ncbi:MAG TPA: pitrilysin family protein, partial [Pirellula sp.]|nr:pitrilysin family protein [Pirellula sp.]
HMMFKGTARRTAEDVNQELDDLGSQSNAYTSEEQTVYYMSILPEFQHASLDLLSDMMRPALRDEDFQTERQVILEEIAMYDDQPPYGAMERAMEGFFRDHPLARRVLGTRETVSQLEPEAMRAYHQARYASDNLTLVASGAVDFEQLLKSAEALTKKWVPSQAKRELVTPTYFNDNLSMVHPPATQQYTLQYSPGPSYRDETRYIARILGTIIGDESGSRLFWELVDTGMAETAATFTQEFQECGLFCTFLACAPEQHDENWEIVQEILQQGQVVPITELELELAKNKICSGMILGSERPSNRLFSIGNAWTIRCKYETIQEASEHYRRVTLEEVQRAFEALDNRTNVTVSVGPETNR